MRKLLLLTALLSTLTVSTLKAEEAASSPIGITVGGTYSSSYLFRGIDWFGGDGAFLPAISYNVLGSGVVLNLAAEQAEDQVLEGKGTKANGNGENSIDAGIGYTAALESFTIGLNVWYWGYYNSKDKWGADWSFVTSNVTLTANTFLAPFVALTWDYYLDKDYADKTTQDYYVQAGVAHETEVVKDVKVKLGVSGGYYNQKTTESKGISDITTTLGTAIAAGPVSYTSSFNYAYIPKGDFRDLKPADHHKFYTNFGVSYTF